jgi:hypothetical protein
MTADNVIGIFTSRAMKERGRYQIQFMKTRSSSGVGQKVDLEFNVDTLRISDLGEEESEGNFNQQRSNNQTSRFTNSFKRTSVVSTNTEETSSSGFDFSKLQNKSEAPKIRSMLNNLNTERD